MSFTEPFAQRFHFRTRRQELNSVEGGTRAHLNYLDQLSKYHKQNGTTLNRFPSVDKRPLDLYRLKKAVEIRGGFGLVCKGKKWAEIGRDLGYSGKIMSSLSTSLKNSYQRYLQPYEEWVKSAKPGVQQQIEAEYGGPITPSPGASPIKRLTVDKPLGSPDASSSSSSTFGPDSPAVRASSALAGSVGTPEKSDIDMMDTTPVKPAMPMPPFGAGFANPAFATSSFASLGSSPGLAPLPTNSSSDSSPPSDSPNGAKKAGELEAGLTPNGSSSRLSDTDGTPSRRESPDGKSVAGSPLKRQHSHDGASDVGSLAESSRAGDSEIGERRSKRLRKGMFVSLFLYFPL